MPHYCGTRRCSQCCRAVASSAVDTQPSSHGWQSTFWLEYVYLLCIYIWLETCWGERERAPPLLWATRQALHVCMHACMVNIPQIVYLAISTPDICCKCNIFVWPATLVPHIAFSVIKNGSSMWEKAACLRAVSGAVRREKSDGNAEEKEWRLQMYQEQWRRWRLDE